MRKNELLYEQLENKVAREYREGKIEYHEMVEKLVEIKKREELSKILDELVIVFLK